jgi:hypothetical protein
MICSYCNTSCTQYEWNISQEEHWTCQSCNCYFRKKDNVYDLILFRRTINNKDYDARLHIVSNKFEILEWIRDDFMSMWFGDLIFSLNFIPDHITPQNIENKIKTYLIFS